MHFNFDNYFNINNVVIDIQNKNLLEIDTPIETMIIEYSKIRKTNSYFYFSALNHNKLDNLNIEKIKIDKEGNCYFRSLSFFMTGKQNYNKEFFDINNNSKEENLLKDNKFPNKKEYNYFIVPYTDNLYAFIKKFI